MSIEVATVVASFKNVVILALAGLSGGVVSYAPRILRGEEVALSRLVVRGGCGILSSVFMTPLVVDLIFHKLGFQISDGAIGGVGFICGAFGISIAMIAEIFPEIIEERARKK